MQEDTKQVRGVGRGVEERMYQGVACGCETSSEGQEFNVTSEDVHNEDVLWIWLLVSRHVEH